MRTTRLPLFLSVLAVGGLAYATLSGPAAQEEMPSFATDHHRKIQASIGEWAGTISWWEPGVPEPMSSPCSEVVAGIGDLWVQSRFEMDMMGTPFIGSHTYGYDTTKEKHVGVWVDSMNPTLTTMEGDVDEATGKVVMHYDMYDAMTGTTKKMRNETAHDGDSYTIEFFEITDDGDQKTMEISMERKQTREAGAQR